LNGPALIALDFVKQGDNGLIAVKPGGQGDVTGSHVVWKATRGLPYVPSPLYYAGRIYLAWLEGKVTVLNAGADRPVVISQAAFGERIAATPALVDRNLYLRTAGHLYAFGP
jgi:hypothetical protein